jgi:hypothetical protein
MRLLHIHCVLHASYVLPEGPSSTLAAILGVLLYVFSSDIDDGKTTMTTTTAANRDLDTGPSQQPKFDSTITQSLDAEASAFWAMEALLTGLREALEEELEMDTGPTTMSRNGEAWNRAFSRMLRAVDAPLWEELRGKSLDPALPYYSSRWIPTLFTHALLRITDVLPIWDAVFTLPQFAKAQDASSLAPQVEFLLDVGVAMLTRARVSLLCLGKGALSPSRAVPRSLWAEEQFALPTSNFQTPSAYSPAGTPRLLLAPSPSSSAWGLVGGLAESEAGEAFLEGVKILQAYDVDEFGGVERVLEGAWGMYARRIGREAMDMHIPAIRVNDGARLEIQTNGSWAARQGHPQPQLSRLDRLADTVWRGITNDVNDELTSPSPSPSPTSPGVAVVPKFTITGPPPNKPSSLGFGARLRDTVWKGVTNQADSDGPSPDPSPEPSPVASRSSSPLLVAEDEEPNLEGDQKPKSGAGAGGGWFGGLRDSNAAATLVKTSTNLRVRAMDVLGRTSPKLEPKPEPEPVSETPSGGLWAASLAAFPSRLGLRVVAEGGQPHPDDLDARPRHGSLPAQSPERQVFTPSFSKHDSYSLPPRPSFRPARDSAISTASTTFSPNSSISGTSTNKGSAIQSALAALTSSSSILAPAPVKKSGPKPLLLNSKSLMTAHGSHSRTPSRSVSPVPPSIADGRTRTSASASSSRTNSVDQLVPGMSGVVSLRRGPVTSARMVGGPHAGRAALSSRDSVSSAGSNRHSDHHFSYEESSAGERDSRTYSFEKTKNPGFIVDRGMDSPITVGNRDSTSTGTSGARTSPTLSLHIEEEVHDHVVSLNDSEGTGAAEQESGDEITIPAEVLLRFDPDEPASASEAEGSPQAKLRAKHHKVTSPLDLNSGTQRGPGVYSLSSPPSAGFSSSLEPGVAYDDNDATPLATTPTTPNLNVIVERKVATLSRSRTPRAARRPRKGTGEERKNSNSTALRSGSEEEGAKADVEDELYTDLINAY